MLNLQLNSEALYDKYVTQENLRARQEQLQFSEQMDSAISAQETDCGCPDAISRGDEPGDAGADRNQPADPGYVRSAAAGDGISPCCSGHERPITSPAAELILDEAQTTCSGTLSWLLPLSKAVARGQHWQPVRGIAAQR